MKNLKEWHYPTSVAAALELLDQGGGATRLIAGGTALAESADPSIEALADLTRIPALHEKDLRADGSVRLGAALTAEQLRQDTSLPPLVRDILGTTVATVGHRMHRNIITIGGNVVQLYPWSDMPVALVALNARYRLEALGQDPREVEAVALVREQPRKVLSYKDMLTQVEIPAPAPFSGGTFLKFSRSRVDYALATAAARVDLDAEGRVVDSTVVVGAAMGRPVRLDDLTARLKGEKPTPALLSKLAAEVKHLVSPTNDFRASVEYRTNLCEVLVRRALTTATERAQAGLLGRQA